MQLLRVRGSDDADDRSQREGIFSMIVLSAYPASLRLGSIECVLTSKMIAASGKRPLR